MAELYESLDTLAEQTIQCGCKAGSCFVQPSYFAREVRAGLAGESVANGEHRVPRRTSESHLIPLEATEQGCRGEKGVSKKTRKTLCGREAKELLKKLSFHIVATKGVDAAPLVRVKDSRTGFVYQLSAGLDDLPRPAEVLAEAAPSEWYLLPHRTPEAGVHVVEGGESPLLLGRQTTIFFSGKAKLLCALFSGGRHAADEDASERSGRRMRSLSPVHPRHPLVATQVLDHRSEPVLVERHGVLHGEGNVLPLRQGNSEIPGHAVIEPSSLDALDLGPETVSELCRFV